MPLILTCDICHRSFRSRDLSLVTIEPPHYEDLPKPTAENFVDVRDEDHPEERVICLHYCEYCLDHLKLPPIEPVSDPSIGPKVHHPGTEHDDGGGSA